MKQPDKLSKRQVKQIKADLASTNGRSQPRIAEAHGVSRSLVSDIYRGRRHADVPWPEGYEPQPNQGRGQRRKTLFDPTNDRIQELDAEVALLKDELALAERQVKADNKSRGLFKAIVDEMSKIVTPFDSLPGVYNCRRKAQIEEHVVMHLSDMHADQVIVPEECGGLEEYNFQIACARAERYVDTVIEWTQDTLSPKFKFPVLTILSYGDHTSGEIHGHAARSYYRNQFKNCFAIGRLKALMVRDLAPYFEAINVVCVPGNHGRRTAKKDHHGAHDNWDYLVAETARMHCADLPNVHWLIPDAWSVNLDINGVGFHLCHGDDIRGWNGIPFYGMVRRQKGLIALGAATGGMRVRYFVMGHHHVGASLSDIDGELLVNGAWPGTDAYAYNSFAGYREPCQWLHGVNPKHGITWRLKCHLKHEREKLGPQRYLIDGGRDVGPLS